MGADLSILDKKGRTPLHTAACLEEKDASMLLSAESDQGLREDTAAILDMLLKYGVDPSIKDLSGRTALDVAESKGSTEIALKIKGGMTGYQLAKRTVKAVDEAQYEIERVAP